MSLNQITFKKKYSNKLITVFEKYGFLFMLLIYMSIFGALNPKFLTVQNITNISVQVVPIGIIALGLLFVLITGGLDLSTGVGVSLAAISMEAIFRFTENPVLAIVAGFITTLILGTFNGIMVSKVKMNPIITTLIMLTIIQGVVFIITRLGDSLNMSNPFFRYIAREDFLGIPIHFLIMIFTYLVGYLVLNHTRLGFYLIAIGNNQEGARLAGINIYKILLYPYIISGFMMGLASMIMVSGLSFITPTFGGVPLLMDALAAVLIGGVALTGGKGTIFGILVGSFAIAIINNSVNLVDIHPDWNQFFKGLIIVIMIIVNRGIENVDNKRVK